MKTLTDEAMREVAQFFQVLAEPNRLKILQLLRDQPMKVGELAELCGSSVPNVSRHLSHMAQQGLVKRQAQGVSALYQVADPAVYELCELVCGSIGRRHAAQMPAQSWFVQST
jgi:DNA-binding transcriptional ArsR family regulator